MTNKTGLDPLETAVLFGLRDCGALPDIPYRKNSIIVDHVEATFGYSQRYTFDLLCNLSRVWEMPLTLVDFNGNSGGGDDPPAPPNVTESRLSQAGSLAVAVEESSAGALPVRLINGTLYRDGKAPSFEPLRVVECLQQLLTNQSFEDGDIIDAIGHPLFFRNPIFDGDIGALYDGEEIECSLTARINVVGTSARGMRVSVTNFPPTLDPGLLADDLEHHTSQQAWDLYNEDFYEEEPRLPLSAVSDRSHGRVSTGHQEVEIKVERGVDIDMFVAALATHRFVREEFTLALPKTLPTMFRDWANEHASDDTIANLAALKALLA